jgi:hypothetical protein
MTTSKSNGAYNTLISLRDKLTRLNGVITPEAINKHEDELGGIFTVAKTHHYEQGQKYGHLTSAIPESKYRPIIGDAAWTHGKTKMTVAETLAALATAKKTVVVVAAEVDTALAMAATLSNGGNSSNDGANNNHNGGGKQLSNYQQKVAVAAVTVETAIVLGNIGSGGGGCSSISVNSLTLICLRAGTKNSRPVGLYSRNSTKSTVNPNTTIPQI